MATLIALPRVDFTHTALSTSHDTSLILKHGKHFGFRLIIGHARHGDQLDTTLVASVLPVCSALFEVFSLALVHDEHYAIIHG